MPKPPIIDDLLNRAWKIERTGFHEVPELGIRKIDFIDNLILDLGTINFVRGLRWMSPIAARSTLHKWSERRDMVW